MKGIALWVNKLVFPGVSTSTARSLTNLHSIGSYAWNLVKMHAALII